MSEWQETEIGNIPTDWELLPIGEIGNVTKLAGFEYTKHITYVEDGEIIALRALNVRDGKLDLSDVKRIYRDVSEGLERSKLIKNDILFTYVGANIGQFALVPENDKFHLAPNICRIRCSEQCHPYFLFSYFRSEYFKESLDGFSHGSSQPTMPMGSIRQIPIPIPPLDEQEAISTVLSSLDDKIDLLHRQNQTLEQLAETLFRQWFVEEADADWEEGVLNDLFVLKRGYDLPKQNRVDGPFPIYAASGESGGHQEYKVKAPGVTTGRSGVLGNVFYVSNDFWPLNTSLYVKEFKRATPLFAYFFLRTIDIKSFNAGSAVPTLNRNHIHEYPVLIPPSKLIEQFDNLINPMFDKIKSNQTQIHTLTALRDTLLPKLMSGEVRVELSKENSHV